MKDFFGAHLVPVPWFPGRARLLGLASAAVLTLLMATARQQIEDHADVRIPAEVHYRGLVRRDKVLSPGVLSTLILADPRVSECVVATAEANGVTVRKRATTRWTPPVTAPNS